MNARKSLPLLASFLLASTPAWSAPTTINGVTYDGSGKPAATAASSVDAAMKLKKIFLFPSVDDLSGVVAPRLDEKLIQLFSRNSRFELVRDSQVLRALAPDDAAYSKAAQNSVVHKEAARVTGSDTTVILRTRNVGSETEMSLEFRDASGELLLAETGSVPGISPMSQRWGLIEKLFQAVLAKIPFDGTVTGRAGNTLTLDLGSALVRPGEEVEVAKIVSVQRHPLLKTIVGTDYVRVGKAKITNADRSISFAEITVEYPGEMIATGAKILRTRASTVRRGEDGNESQTGGRESAGPLERDPFEDRLKGDFDETKPRYGKVGGNLQFGSLSYAQSAPSNSEFSGSGIGGNLEAEVWVTKNWIVTGYYGFHNGSLSSDTSSAIGDTTWKKGEGYVGYRLFPGEVADSLQLTGSVGYQMQNFDMPINAQGFGGGKKFSGPALKLDGDMLFLRDQSLSFTVGCQPFSSLTEKTVSLGAPDGGTVISLALGWNYRFVPSVWGRIGFQFDTASGSYENNTTITNKRFAIGPGLYYSF